MQVSVRVPFPTGVAAPDPQVDSLIEFAQSTLDEHEHFFARKEFQYTKEDSLTNEIFTGKLVFEFFDGEEIPVPDGDPAQRFRNELRDLKKTVPIDSLLDVRKTMFSFLGPSTPEARRSEAAANVVVF